MKGKNFILAIMILLIGIGGAAGCAQFGKPATSFVDWSPKQRAAYFMAIYSEQYDLYKIQAAYPDLTPAERETLRVKRQVLTEASPLISGYDFVVAAGGIPTAKQEAEILAMLDQIQRAAIRRVEKK
jgi:hypothetical protein